MGPVGSRRLAFRNPQRASSTRDRPSKTRKLAKDSNISKEPSSVCKNFDSDVEINLVLSLAPAHAKYVDTVANMYPVLTWVYPIKRK